MSVFSTNPREGNPVTTDTLDNICAKLGVSIHEGEKEDYRRLLAVFHESAEELMSLPDETPFTDSERFPRQNVHLPSAQENEYGAWAWKCSIKDPGIRDGSLSGKTLAMKDNIAVKDVPMLLGTNFIQDFVPVGLKMPCATTETERYRLLMQQWSRASSRLAARLSAKQCARTCAIAPLRTQPPQEWSKIRAQKGTPPEEAPADAAF